MGGDAGPEAVRKVAVHTLGCRVNQYDSEAMLARLAQAGYEPAAPGEAADVCIVNTCVVTAESERKSRQMIRRAAAAHPGAVLVAAGCLSQRAPDETAAIAGVDVIIGTDGRNRIAELVESARRGKITAVGDLRNAAFEEMAVDYRGHPVRVNVKIEEGCGARCTYCVIPQVRGPVRSRPPERVAAQCRRLFDAGCREIVLTGIRLSSYGEDLEGAPGLAGAVEAAAAAAGEGRVRLGSLDPEIINGDFLERIAALGDRVCPQFHVALQSGCDATLRRMGRGYDTWTYRERIALLRGILPGAAVTTDIIAGFPGESEADFEATAAFAEEMAFSRLHAFPYSPRPGTAAARLPILPNGVRQARAARLCRLGARLEAEFAASRTGKILRALFEEAPEEGFVEGYSGEFARVRAPGPPDWIGTIRNVRIERAEGAVLWGRVVEKEKEA